VNAEHPQPDYLPPLIKEWAHGHAHLLDEIIRATIQRHGWPSVRSLTRDLARRGRPMPLYDILFQMPKPLGLLDRSSDRVVLSLFALRLVPAGRPLLDDFTSVLRLAVQRYEGSEDDPKITRRDLYHELGLAEDYVAALSEIVVREAPFLGNVEGGPDDDWTRTIDDSVVRYWEVQTPDDYLRIRASELRTNPIAGWGYGLVEGRPAEPQSDPPDGRDVFISHAGEDKASVARPLERLLTHAGWGVWLDELELIVGDSLNTRLNQALAQSRFGVVILSRAFFSKHWPQQELNALAAKEAASGSKVILPVWHGIDEHYLAEHAPMLADRVGVATERGLEHVAEQLIRALERARGAPPEQGPEPVVQSVPALLQREPALDRVPRTKDEQAALLRVQPAGWEYLLFASQLLLGKDSLEAKWHDHELRLGRGTRGYLDDVAASRYVSNAIGDFQAATSRLTRVLQQDAQTAAFGRLGEPGNPDRIKHVAMQLINGYEELLDTTAALRNQRVPDRFGQVFDLAAQLVDRPYTKFDPS
jgi:TIR domain